MLGFDVPLETLVGTLLVGLRITAFIVVAPPLPNVSYMRTRPLWFDDMNAR